MAWDAAPAALSTLRLLDILDPVAWETRSVDMAIAMYSHASSHSEAQVRSLAHALST